MRARRIPVATHVTCTGSAGNQPREQWDRPALAQTTVSFLLWELVGVDNADHDLGRRVDIDEVVYRGDR